MEQDFQTEMFKPLSPLALAHLKFELFALVLHHKDTCDPPSVNILMCNEICQPWLAPFIKTRLTLAGPADALQSCPNFSL